MARLGGVILINRIPFLMAAVEVNTRSAVKKSAEKVVRDAKARAPILTGELRGSIGSKSRSAGKSVDIFASARHAIFQEYGTANHSAQPFLYPALMAEWPDFKTAIGKTITF